MRRSQPVVVALVSVDPVIRNRRRGDDEGSGFRVLVVVVVVVVVEGVGVEGLVTRGNGVDGSSDGADEIEIDGETPGDAFCMEGHWCVEQLKLWVGFEDGGERTEDWMRRRGWTYA
jgi:hypothetical protein